MTDTEKQAVLDSIKQMNKETIDEALKGNREGVEKGLREMDAKMDGLNARLDRMDKSFADMQTRLVAPGAIVENSAERGGFRDYMRTGRIVDSMTESVASEGGVLVPPAQASELIHLVATANPLRELASVVSVSNPQYVALVRNTVGSAVVGTEGGMVSSGAAIPLYPTATPTFAKVIIEAKDIYSCQPVTRDLLQDSEFPVETEIAAAVADQIGNIEASQMILGSGGSSGEMQGLVGGVTTVADSSWAAGSVGYVAGGSASTLTSPDALLTMQGNLDDRYQANAAWLMNNGTYNTLRTLKAGSGGANQYLLWRPEIVGERYAMTLAGVPVRRCATMPDIGANAYPVAYGDFRAAYRIVDRTGIIIIRDEVTRTPEVLFKVIKRTGGGVVNTQAYKLLKVAVS